MAPDKSWAALGASIDSGVWGRGEICFEGTKKVRAKITSANTSKKKARSLPIVFMCAGTLLQGNYRTGWFGS
jgi:hypothetical protein